MSDEANIRGESAAPAISEQFLNKAEFHQEIGWLKGAIRKEAQGLRESIGWGFIVLAAWLFYIGVLMATQSIRGSR